MMDLSDGLAKDLPRMAKSSACGYQVDRQAIPITPGCNLDQALGDGEDFELLFAIDEHKASTLVAAWSVEFPDLPLTRIGHLVEPGGGDSLEGGWDHFNLRNS
jgi:thiamine-monophosphate kinase